VSDVTRKRGVSFLTRQTKSQIITIAILIVVFILVNIIVGNRFLTWTNISSILSNSVSSVLLVFALCFIFGTGITDLSLGAVSVLASNVAGILALNAGLGYFGLVIGGTGCAVLCVLLNMSFMQYLKIPSWILGIGMTMIYEGIGSIYNSHMVNQGKQAVSLGDSYRILGRQPYNYILLLIVIVVAYFIYNRTSIGFGLRAVGSNRSVAEIMGIDATKATLYAGIVGGLFLGMAAVVSISYSSRVTPTTGLTTIGTIFTAIAGFLLAQTLTKIFNIIFAVVIGTILVTVIYNIMTLFGIPSGTWQEVVMGLIVLIGGIISNRGTKGAVK